MQTFAESFIWIEIPNNFFIYYSTVHEPDLSYFWGDSLLNQF